ncbi:peptidase S16 lon domain protein (plasmid) [Paenibacillus thiaminolyticus]|uniref:peptidase S16 lon domain protein n=1 Tax=Paenibacillus thiaminolyticus TaxID=49283 RepID=UPI00232CE0C3|nr:peptidase S16 lon domain protein [Paenibacillus thiaminolyticus]WCF11503.1 peptidase S16 lon domain protein [Paenibacillus thiaminolyticus]
MKVKTIKILFGSLLLFLIFLIVLMLIPSGDYKHVKEGAVVGVNQFINTRSLGGKEVDGSDFYLTYVNTNSSPTLLHQFVNRITGYEKSITSNEVCRDFDYDDETEYGERILPYMSQNAISSAMHAAGIEPEGVLLNPIVLSTAKNIKTSKLFKPGDKVLSLNGEELMTGELFSFILNKHQEGDLINVIIERDGKQKEVSFIASERDCNNQLTAGIYVETTVDITNINEEEVVDTKRMDFTGNSAGLMLSIGIAQQLLNEDLSHGKKIAGTGSINTIGIVGKIGSLDMKIRTAIKEGADVFLYPKSQENEIYGDYKKDISLIPVESLDDAIAALRQMK